MKRKVAKKGRCPFDGKVTYRDEKSARRALRNARNAPNSDKYPQRTYECEHGYGWHLTSTDEISGMYAEMKASQHEL